MEESSKHHLHSGSGGAAITVHVETNCSRNKIAEILNDGTVRVQIKVAAHGERVNHPLLEYLSHALQVPAARMEIVAGKATADKLIAILNVDSAVLQEQLIDLVGK